VKNQGMERGRLTLGSPAPLPAEGPNPSTATRAAAARVVIRPARPDDLEDATLLERRVWGRLSATLNELQRRLFALPEAFLLAELQRSGRPPLGPIPPTPKRRLQSGGPRCMTIFPPTGCGLW